jgi:hypothetical protein
MAHKLSKPRTHIRPDPVTWRVAPDSVLLAHLPTSHLLDRAESLCPTLSTIERAADATVPGHRAARAIIAAWQPVFKVTAVRA